MAQVISKCYKCGDELSVEMDVCGKPVQVVCENCGFSQLVGASLYCVCDGN